ncbi:MAG: glycosyltransferase [Nitrospirota bacterium]
MEEVIHNISMAMLAQQCEPYVFAPYVRGADNRTSVPYKVLRYQRPSSRRFGVRQLLVPLLWYHFRYRFDVLHCHSVYPPGYVGVTFHRITGVPLVITPHGGDIKVNAEGYIINRRISARVHKTFSSAQAVTALSSDVRAKVLTLGARPERVHIIPNGVALNQYRPSEEEGHRHDAYILYLGRLSKVKEIDILLHAFSKVSRKYPHVRLKIAGDGKEMNALKALADELGIAERTDFLGIVRGQEKIRLLQSALFFVCPRVINNIGLSNLEALASGLPVITSKASEVSSIIRDGESGFLIDPGDVEQLAERIALLVKDEPLRQQMSEGAINAAARFDWVHITEKYLNAYKSLLP